MKKIFLLLLMILTVSGCGSSNDEKTVKVGTLTKLNSTAEQVEKISGDVLNFYDDFQSMQMALSTKKIDKIQTYGSVAKYLTAHNSDFVIDDSQQTVELVDNFCLATRENDIELKNSLDAAINSMKSDGTLDALIKEFILDPQETPHAVALPHFDGAKTIHVGITGDLPPLDLVLADGTPAGFNTAVLAEISKRIQMNVELIQINSAARAVALTSGQIDVIFWVVVPDDESNRPKNLDTPAGVAVTDPYYQDIVVTVNLSNLGAGF